MKSFSSENPCSLRKSQLSSLLAIGFLASTTLLTSCSSDNNSTPTDTFIPTEPLPLDITGTALKCDNPQTDLSAVAVSTSVVTPDSIQDYVVSRDDINDSPSKPNAQNTINRLSAVVSAQLPNTPPEVDAELVHPLLISYAEQVVGPYELGDGSADIGDPNTLDDIFTSLSLDNGNTWKKVAVGDTASKSSINVSWNGATTAYNGHSHKPTMAVQGNNILVAWNDKYCPSGNPFDLVDPATEDYYKVNGTQGVIDYGGLVAPNDKVLYEVPFSCVWTARGVFGDADGDGTHEIDWRQAQQLTSGARDSNKIWIAPAEVGFALTWQEDTEGLRSGKGAGPGEGYSGATTNHGTDIWYTYMPVEDFDDVCTDVDCTTTTDDPLEVSALPEKPKPAINFASPVRISNNETCSPGDTKLYCADNCITSVERVKGNQSGDTVQRCVQDDLDYMTPDTTIAPAAAVLDGDTGASRPALKILKTNADVPEYVAVLVYEETKGLSESDPDVPNSDDPTTDIAVEGKSVYFESFYWDQPVDVSAGRIVNLRVPQATVDSTDSVTLTGLDIYENARRVVIASQVDSCEAQDGDYTFGLMYKQGYSTQGDPSDMYIRMNKGFTYEEFEATATNVSARETIYDIDGKVESISWSTANLDDMSYDNSIDNTFSPRAFLRGSEIYTGFEYSPNWRQTSNGTTPNNFWIHRHVDSIWQGPQQVTNVAGAYGVSAAKVSTLDPRFFPTPKGSFATTGIESDKSNPDVLIMTYGTFDMDTGVELDLFYSRSTDKGATWETVTRNEGTVDEFEGHAKLAARADVEEKEVQTIISPDGTMLFNTWLQETHTLCADPWCGLETRFGMVPYAVAP